MAPPFRLLPTQPPLESVFLSFVHTDGRASVADTTSARRSIWRRSSADVAPSPSTPATPGSGAVPPFARRLGRLCAKAQPRVRALSVELSSTRV